MTQIEIVLIVALGMQQFFWMRTTQRLIDKLMSRNYHEYKQAETFQETLVNQGVKTAPEFDAEDLRSLEGIGSSF